MDLKQILDQSVEKFHITTEVGIKFWAPYIRNDNFTQDPNVPRGLGKASPEEITESANYITSIFPEATPEIIRKKLIDGTLPEKEMNYKGIDCSGFVFYVMDFVYNQLFGKELMDDLSVPKDHVLNGANNLLEWQAAYKLSEAEAAELPEDVPMRWVVEKFKRKPQNLCRVTGLVSDYSSIPVGVDHMRTGDLINMKNDDSAAPPHVSIITKIDIGSVEIVHSGRRNSEDVGGVKYEVLKINEDQIDTENMQVPHKFMGVRRLKSLQ